MEKSRRSRLPRGCPKPVPNSVSRRPLHFVGAEAAAAVTAAWSRLPSLQTRTLFYSTDSDNRASRRVASRLGLTLRGTTLRVA